MIAYKIVASVFYMLGFVLSLLGFAASISKAKGPEASWQALSALIYVGMIVWTWLL